MNEDGESATSSADEGEGRQTSDSSKEMSDSLSLSEAVDDKGAEEVVKEASPTTPSAGVIGFYFKKKSDEY